MAIFRELFDFARARKRLWLVPMLVMLVVLLFALFWGGSYAIQPFRYFL